MRMYLYQLQGDKRYLDKTPYLTSLGNASDPSDEGQKYFNAVMLDDTSIMDPTFVFSYHEYWYDWNNKLACNYIWSQDLLRWYFVQDVTVSQGRVYVKCHVDVLMTYRNYIKEKKALIKRTNATTDVGTNRYNQYLPDDKFKSYAPEVVWAKKFPENRGFDNRVSEFVMCVVGNIEGTTPPEPEENREGGEDDGNIRNRDSE